MKPPLAAGTRSVAEESGDRTPGRERCCGLALNTLNRGIGIDGLLHSPFLEIGPRLQELPAKRTLTQRLDADEMAGPDTTCRPWYYLPSPPA